MCKPSSEQVLRDKPLFCAPAPALCSLFLSLLHSHPLVPNLSCASHSCLCPFRTLNRQRAQNRESSSLVWSPSLRRRVKFLWVRVTVRDPVFTNIGVFFFESQTSLHTQVKVERRDSHACKPESLWKVNGNERNVSRFSQPLIPAISSLPLFLPVFPQEFALPLTPPLSHTHSSFFCGGPTA